MNNKLYYIQRTLQKNKVQPSDIEPSYMKRKGFTLPSDNFNKITAMKSIFCYENIPLVMSNDSNEHYFSSRRLTAGVCLQQEILIPCPEEVLPLINYFGMCRSEGYGFVVV